VFIAGVNGTDDNLYMLVSTTPAMKQLQQCQLFYIYMKKKNHNRSVKSNQAASKVNMKKKIVSHIFSLLTPVINL
jgi:hypothetical protein